MALKQIIKNAPIIGPIATSLGNTLRKLNDTKKRFWFYYKNKNYLTKNSELKNSQNGKKCFILATGPSIKTQDLSKLEDQFCISLSNFFVHPDFKKIKPEYHIFVASHSPVTDEQFIAWFKDAEKHFPEGQKVLISITDKYLIDNNNLFRKQKVYYYSVGDIPLNYLGRVNFTKQLPAITTSAHLGIYLAFYLGCNEINLLGCDHDWLLHFNESKHFYSEKENVMTKIGYTGWHSFEVTLKSNLILWKTYRWIKRFAEKNEVRIYNSTPKSLLDVFPRIGLDEIFKRVDDLKNSRISFVVPAYNCAGTIEESVESIMDGNFTPGDELIIVNDGSTDGTLKVVIRLQKKYPFIKVINQENKGCPAARNVGYAKASNPIIFQLYSDDVLERGTVPKLREYMITEGADMAAFQVLRYFKDGKYDTTHRWISRPGLFTFSDFLAGEIHPGSGGNYMFTKKLWERVGGVWEYGKGLHEAWGFTMKVLANGAKMVIMPDSYYFHRYGMNSLYIRESRKLDEHSLMATKMISHYLHLLNDEDAAYISSEEGSRTWYSGINRMPLRLKTGEKGQAGIYRRNPKLAVKISISRRLPWLVNLYLRLKNR